ncbi:MAG: hypothetical protein ACI4J3_03275 [Oscillospiraceae bacterium]
MPEYVSANGSQAPFLSDEERRRMTEENRAQAVRNSPHLVTRAQHDDDAARRARYEQSAQNLRAAFLRESDANPRRQQASIPDDAGYPRGARGGFPYIAGANAYAPWQEEPADAEETQSIDAMPEYDAEPMPEYDADDHDVSYDDARFPAEAGIMIATARRFGELIRSGIRRTPVAAIRVFFLAACALALLGGTIYGKVKTNEVYTALAVAQSEYDDLKASNVSLRSEIDGKTTVKNVEEYAEDVLGLMPLDDSQIKYIKIQTEDQVIIAEPEQSIWEKLRENFRAVWAWLRGA